MLHDHMITMLLIWFHLTFAENLKVAYFFFSHSATKSWYSESRLEIYPDDILKSPTICLAFKWDIPSAAGENKHVTRDELRADVKRTVIQRHSVATQQHDKLLNNGY